MAFVCINPEGELEVWTDNWLSNGWLIEIDDGEVTNHWAQLSEDPIKDFKKYERVFLSEL